MEQLLAALKDALEPFEEVRFALLFGSAVTGRLREDSDIDLAVYIDSQGRLEVEEPRDVPEEAGIQIAAERATDRNIDLLILNRAPATVCATAVLEGKSVLVREPGLYSRYFLAVTSVAIDFSETEREFREIRKRSRSISQSDESHLERILDFVDEELADRAAFEGLTLNAYRTDRNLRRNLDRWVETLVNACIDIGKIVLSSTGREVPRTYGQILSDLETVRGFEKLAGRLAPLAPLRNLLAHEYLDLRFDRVKAFVAEGSHAVEALAAVTRTWLTKEGQKP